jgi:hypothetical protein
LISTNGIDIPSFHRYNLRIWWIFLSSIALISIGLYILDQLIVMNFIEMNAYIDHILFLIAIVLALLIIILKRSLFLPANIINAINKQNVNKKDILLLNILRRNYIIVWSLGEFICLVGFINYLFFTQLKSFLAYLIVSVYSLIVNTPRLSLVEKSIEILNKNLENGSSV